MLRQFPGENVADVLSIVHPHSPLPVNQLDTFSARIPGNTDCYIPVEEALTDTVTAVAEQFLKEGEGSSIV
jgi:hypothetical protein